MGYRGRSFSPVMRGSMWCRGSSFSPVMRGSLGCRGRSFCPVMRQYRRIRDFTYILRGSVGCRGRSFIHNNSTQVEVFLQIFTGSGINGIQNLEINAYCSALHYTVFVFILVRKWKLKSGHHSDENLTLRSERIGYAGFFQILVLTNF